MSWRARCCRISSISARVEQRADGVIGSDGKPRRSVERGHERDLHSVLGEVAVTRLAYRAAGSENLYPADARLNLPPVRYSHGIGKLAALEAPRSSFEDAQAAIVRQTGQQIGTRQLRELTLAGAQDVDAFYEQRERTVPDGKDLLVLWCDAKGVVMRPEGLREQTRTQAQNASGKLKTRLSKGEKTNRKRDGGDRRRVRAHPRATDRGRDPARPREPSAGPQLLDLCGVTDTVIGDADGIYHPGSFNDRLLLGFKGTMSEADDPTLSNSDPSDLRCLNGR